MAVDVVVPVLGPEHARGTLTEWYRADGEAVRAGELVCRLEAGMVALDLEAEEDGVLRHLGGTGVIAPWGSVAGVILAPGESLDDDEFAEGEPGEAPEDGNAAAPGIIFLHPDRTNWADELESGVALEAGGAEPMAVEASAADDRWSAPAFEPGTTGFEPAASQDQAWEFEPAATGPGWNTGPEPAASTEPARREPAFDWQSDHGGWEKPEPFAPATGAWWETAAAVPAAFGAAAPETDDSPAPGNTAFDASLAEDERGAAVAPTGDSWRDAAFEAPGEIPELTFEAPSAAQGHWHEEPAYAEAEAAVEPWWQAPAEAGAQDVPGAQLTEEGAWNAAVANEPLAEDVGWNAAVADEPLAEDVAWNAAVADEPLAEDVAWSATVADEPLAEDVTWSAAVADEPLAEDAAWSGTEADEPLAEDVAWSTAVADEPLAEDIAVSDAEADEAPVEYDEGLGDAAAFDTSPEDDGVSAGFGVMESPAFAVEDVAAPEAAFAPAPAVATLTMKVTVAMGEARRACEHAAREWRGEPLSPMEADVVLAAIVRAAAEAGLDPRDGMSGACLLHAGEAADRMLVVPGGEDVAFASIVDARQAEFEAAPGECACALLDLGAWGIDEGVAPLAEGLVCSFALGGVRDVVGIVSGRPVTAPVATLTLAYAPEALPPAVAATLLARVRELIEAPQTLLAA